MNEFYRAYDYLKYVLYMLFHGLYREAIQKEQLTHLMKARTELRDLRARFKGQEVHVNATIPIRRARNIARIRRLGLAVQQAKEGSENQKLYSQEIEERKQRRL